VPLPEQKRRFPYVLGPEKVHIIHINEPNFNPLKNPAATKIPGIDVSRKAIKLRQAKVKPSAQANSRARNDSNPFLRIREWLKSLINRFMHH